MHRNFTAAAECQSRGSNDNWFWGVAHAHVQALQSADCSVELVPHTLLCRNHNHKQIRTCAKVICFTTDHQAIEISIESIQGFGCDCEDIVIQGVHLGVEFNQRNAIANIKQGGACVFVDFLLRTAKI